MSRGPGKWQHGILVALKAHPTMYLNDLLPKDGARAGYNSLRRAAYALASRGAIIIRHRARADRAHVVIARPGHNGSAGAAKEGKAMKVTAFKRRCRVVQEDGPNPIDVFVGKRMRARRLREGLSQIAVADRLGVSFQALHKYETADTRVSASVLYGLAQIFGVTPNYFFQGYAPGATKRSKRGRGTRANPNR